MELLKAVRIATLTPQEFEKDHSILFSGIPEDPLSLESEIVTCDYLVKKCRSLYNNYPTTIEEDKEILEDPNSSLNYKQRIAVQLRLGEKEIINRIGAYFYDKEIELIEQLKQEQNKE